MRLCYSPEFMERKSQLLEAAKLTREGRYLAADAIANCRRWGWCGCVWQVDFRGGSGSKRAQFVCRPTARPTNACSRNVSYETPSSDNLSFPYRNGIIHGRDLGYDNRLVNAKCWSLLGNIADVLKAREKAQSQKSEPQPSLREVLANSLETHARTKKFDQRLNEWTARPVRDDPIHLSDEIGSSVDANEPGGDVGAIEGLEGRKLWADGQDDYP